MKKQFLFLILFVAAIVAGTSNVFAQKTYLNVPNADKDGSVDCLTPTPLNCTITAAQLHPVQGQLYTYSVDNVPTDATVRWFVVNNADLTSTSVGGGLDSLVGFNGILAETRNDYIDAIDGTGAYDITSTSYIMSVTSGATNYNKAVANLTSIDMSWKFFNGLPPNEVLLVAYVEDAATCTNNIAVWRIIPTPSFTLDVAALSENGDSIAPAQSTDVAEVCVSPIESAIYNSSLGTVDPDETPGDSLIVDYGENWVYFVVNAANFIDSWMPTFQFTYLGTGDIPGFEASWAYIGDATSTTATDWHAISGTLGAAASDFTTTQAVIAGANAATENQTGFTIGNGNVPNATGECIVVRARLDWGTQIEHDLNSTSLKFAVDGVYYDGDNSNTTGGDSFFNDRGYADLDVTGCADDNFTNDWVDYVITPRPHIENGTPTQEIKTGQGVN